MNEPIQYVHRQEDSNSTIMKSMAIGVGTSLAFEAMQEAGMISAYKMAKKSGNKSVEKILHDTLYTDSHIRKTGMHIPFTNVDLYQKIPDGKVKNAIGKIPVFGMSTGKGRAVRYGLNATTGLIGGLVAGTIIDREG